MLRALLVATSLLGIAAEDDTCSTVLHYFNIRGRAEAIRMALHDLNIPFVDHSFSGDEWGKEKADGLKANWTAAGKLSFRWNSRTSCSDRSWRSSTTQLLPRSSPMASTRGTYSTGWSVRSAATSWS